MLILAFVVVAVVVVAVVVEWGEFGKVDDHVGAGLMEMLIGSIFPSSSQVLLSLRLAIDTIEGVTCCPECSEK